jgi:hypothetical protein
MKTLLRFTALVLLSAAPAMAWNCPTGQRRVQAPTGTPTSTPFYDVVEGIAFICEPTTPPTPPTNPPSTSNSTSSANSSSNSSSNSAANSSSSANNSVNNSVKVDAKGGTATATGGSVKNSGNSSNTNTNTNVANGGAGGAVKNSGNSSLSNVGNASSNQTQSQTQSASANGNGVGNGNNSNNYSNSTKVEAAAATAFASSMTTANCAVGFGAGGQLIAGGVSFSGAKIDKNCASLEAARAARNIKAFCKVYITNKFVKAAGVTLEDCLESTPIPVVPVEKIEKSVVVPVPVTVNVPAPEPRIIVTTNQRVELPSCVMYGGSLTNTCKRFLDDVALRLTNNQTAVLRLDGPKEGGKAFDYLASKGVSRSRIDLRGDDDMNWTLRMSLTWSE